MARKMLYRQNRRHRSNVIAVRHNQLCWQFLMCTKIYREGAIKMRQGGIEPPAQLIIE